MNEECLRMSEEEFISGMKWLCERLESVRFQKTASSKDGLYLHNWKIKNLYNSERSKRCIPAMEHEPILQTVMNSKVISLSGTEYDDDSVDMRIEADESIHTGLLFQTEPASILEWKFTVIYSHVWNVPILYFQVHYADGALLSVEDMWRNVENESLTSIDDPWSFISYEEHPLTGMPSFFLHPCQTSRRLKIIMGSSDAKENEGITLFGWLSMILPSIGFRISHEVLMNYNRSP